MSTERARNLFGEEEIATAPRDAAPTGEYRKRAAYYTPDELALRICQELHGLGIRPKRILEPGCGGGAFLRAAAATWPAAQIVGIDLEPHCAGPGQVHRGDVFGPMASDFCLALGNPPFTHAEEFIHRGLELVRPGGYVAFLLRLALLAGKRALIYPENPVFHVGPLSPRPSFTGGGSDKAQEYGLICWRRGHDGGFTGKRIVWKESRR